MTENNPENEANYDGPSSGDQNPSTYAVGEFEGKPRIENPVAHEVDKGDSRIDGPYLDDVRASQEDARREVNKYDEDALPANAPVDDLEILRDNLAIAEEEEDNENEIDPTAFVVRQLPSDDNDGPGDRNDSDSSVDSSTDSSSGSETVTSSYDNPLEDPDFKDVPDESKE